jgi:transporter family protein
MSAPVQAWQLWALLAAVAAALTAIFAKLGVDTVDAHLATFIRTLVVAAVLSALLLATGQWRTVAAIPARGWLFLVLSGLATCASWVCYFQALQLGDAARVAPIDKLSVVLVAVFGVLFLGEQLAASHWLGIALIAAGALLVARPA